jgi:hypothetical protein
VRLVVEDEGPFDGATMMTSSKAAATISAGA